MNKPITPISPQQFFSPTTFNAPGEWSDGAQQQLGFNSTPGDTPFLNSWRVQERLWCPGIINCHDIERGLLFYLPLWERGGKGSTAANLNLGVDQSFPTLATAQEWVVTNNGYAKYFNHETGTCQPFTGGSGGTNAASMGDFTLSFWANWDTTATSPTATTYVVNWPSGAVTFYVRSSGGTITCTFGASTASGTDSGSRYYNIVFTRLGTTGTWYINGLSVASTTVVSTTCDLSTLVIGDPASNDGFKGYIQRVGLWNRALTNNEVDDLWRDPDLIQRCPRTFMAFHIATSYDIDLDTTGANAGGSATFNEVFNPSTPTGGVLGGGSNTTQETFVPPVSGGVLGDGSNTAQETFVPPVSGGVLGGGAGTNNDVYNPTPTSGALGGGAGSLADDVAVSGGVLGGGADVDTVQFNPTPIGGALGGGSNTTQETFVPPVSGGVLGDGADVDTAQFNPTPTDGALAGGSDVDNVQFNLTPSGGVVVAGTAPFYEDFVPPITGGVLIDGTLVNYDESNPDTSGGVLVGVLPPSAICDGEALVVDDVQPPVSGGVVVEGFSNGALVGGAVIVPAIFNLVGTGGILASGVGTVNSTYFTSISGGVLVGGTATVSHNISSITVSGGVLCGGYAATGITILPSGGALCAGDNHYTMTTPAVLGVGGILIGGEATFPLMQESTTVLVCNRCSPGGDSCSVKNRSWKPYYTAPRRGDLQPVGAYVSAITICNQPIKNPHRPSRPNERDNRSPY